jgi:hydroxypyruvate isomerase
MLVGVSTYCLRNQFQDGQLDLLSFIDKCKNQFGADAVEFLPEHFALAEGSGQIRGFPRASQIVRTPEYLGRLVDRAEEMGIVISAMSARGDFAQDSAIARAADVADLKEWVDITAEMGVPVMRVYGASRHDGMIFEQSLPWIVAGLKEVAAYAGTKGVRLGMEDHGAITAVSQVKAIVDAVDSPHLGVLMDAGNFQHFGQDPVAAARTLGPWIVHVHLKEAKRGPDGSLVPCAVGDGDMDVHGVVEALHDVKYDGCLALEYGLQVNAEEIVRRSITYVRQVLRDLEV